MTTTLRSQRPALELALALAIASAAASPAAAQAFRRNVNVDASTAVDLISKGDGSSLLVGTTSSATSFVTLDPAGSIGARRTVSATNGLPLGTAAAATLGDGTLVLAGKHIFHAHLTGVDPDSGAERWSHSFGTDLASFVDVAPTSDGGVIALGTDDDFGGGGSLGLVVRLDAAGDVLWEKNFAGASSTPFPHHVVGTADGGALLLHGGSEPGLPGSPYGMLATRITDWGAIHWQRRYQGDFPLFGQVAVELPDGGFTLAGATELGQGTGDTNFFAVRVAADGLLLWSQRYDTWPSNPSAGVFHEVVGAVPAGDGAMLLVKQPMPAIEFAAGADTAFLRIDGAGDVALFRSVGETGVDDAPLALGRAAGGYTYASQVDGDGDRVSRVDNLARVGGSCAIELDLPIQALDLAVGMSPESLPLTPSSTATQGVATTTQHEGGTNELVCGNFCWVTGGGFGDGLAGSGGIVPQLVATSGYCIGGEAEVSLYDGLGGTLGFLGLTTQTAGWPFLGGLNYLSPASTTYIVVTTDGTPGVAGAGTLSLPISGDLSGLSGATIYFQAFLFDDAAPQDWSMTRCATLLVQ